ncbi:MAG: hypothetical protein LBV20_06295, partial [Treponema sp.]|jgi:tetratricopeptide (TPR) repeat protein|nr:hypothetical protein [Treponema sp.]
MAKTIYKTEDGKEFDSQYQAEYHANDLARHRAEMDAIETKKIQERSTANSITLDGVKLYEQGDYDGAIAAYTRALNVKGFDVYYANRASAYLAKGDYDSAITDATKAFSAQLSGSLTHCKNYFIRGRAYYRKDDYDNAIADYTKGLNLATGSYEYNPEIAGRIYNGLGDIYSKMGKENLSVENFKKGADFGDSEAKQNLTKRGIRYTPVPQVRPKEPKEKGRTSAYGANNKTPSGWLSLILAIPCGIGFICAILWIVNQIYGDQLLEGIILLLVIAVGIFAAKKILESGKRTFVITLFALALIGWLVLFGIIPEFLFR